MRLQVSLRAERLKNVVSLPRRLRGRKSDPYATIMCGEEMVGRTEIIQNELSPVWTTVTIFDHNESSSVTTLKITIRDCSRNWGAVQLTQTATTTKKKNKNDDVLIGDVNVGIDEVLKAEGQELKLDIFQGGCIYVCITESYNKRSDTRVASSTSANTGVFHCHLRALDLQNIEKGLLGLGAIDPYYEIAKRHVDNDHGVERWITVYRSERLYNIVNPHWSEWKLDMEKLCHGDAAWELRITIWDHENLQKDRWIGACEKVSVDEFLAHVTKSGNASREDALSIMNECQEEVGLIIVLKADILLE